MSLSKNMKERTSTKNTKNMSGDGESKSMERIKELVEKTTKMQLVAEDRQKQTEQYFKQLRERLDSSSSFLKNAKNDIDNIKFVFQRDHAVNMQSQDYLDTIDKTDEEIEDEIKTVQEKLANLQNRLHTLKSQTRTEAKTFEEAISNTITALNEANQPK